MAFIVAAVWQAKPGEEHRIREVIDLMTPPSREEPGNLFYQAHVDPEDPTRFFLYEQYTSPEAYEEHKQTEHFQKYVFGYAIEYLADRHVDTYYTIGDGPAT